MKQNNKNNWFENNPWKAKMIIFVIAILVLEVSIRFLVFLGFAPYQQYPTIAGGPAFWDDIDPVVGVWRYPNKTFNHKSSCFDVTYQTNSYGAVDLERDKKSNAAQRIVVLGDSYVEGFGIERENRLTNLLEKRTGIELLNFGTSGSFGTIQEWKLYESLATQFDHTDVMLFILPANDFSDNNPNDFPKERFRPYLRKKDGAFELYYTVSFEQRKRVFRDWGVIIKNTIDNTSCLANFLRFANREIKNRLEGDDAQKKQNHEIAPAHYNNYTSLDMEIMLHSLSKISDLAGKKNVYLFTIPSFQDYTWALEKGYDFQIVNHLATFAQKHPNVHYQDLLPDFMTYAQKNTLDYSDFAHTCDGHWNELGNKVAADSAFTFVNSLSSPSKTP